MTKTILIVGGGVIGLCVAYYAQQKGHRMIIVERGAPTHDSCSLGNAGMIVPSHFVPLAAPGMVSYGLRAMWNPESPFYIRPRLSVDLIEWGLKFMRSANATHVQRAAPLLRDLNLASRACYAELDEAWGNNFGLVQKGLLMLCQTEHGLRDEAAMAAQANALGIPAEVMTPEQMAKLDPNVTMRAVGGVYFPKDCHLSPMKFVAGLTRHLEQNGATFRWQTNVMGWGKANGAVTHVQTNAGALEADEYVVAGGAWTPNVARGLGLRLPMQAGKGYSLTLPHPKQLPDICAIFVEARVAVTPMNGSLRFGGTMEITGLDESINPARVRGIVKSVPQYYPAFSERDFEGVQAWRGLRPVSPDGLPYIGRASRYRNISIAAGHAMMGLSLGPITGKLMAQVLSDETPEMDLGLVRVERFG